MGVPAGIVIVLIAVQAPCYGVLAWRAHRARAAAERAARGATERSAASLRLLRLAAGELRGLALALVGQSQAGEPCSTSQAVARIADRLVGLSEALLAQSETPGGVRRLEEEVVPLRPVLEFAVAQVAAGLGPGRRAWRIGGVPAGAALFADRRALNHILVNVLSGAAASTRDGDGIDVSLHEEDGTLLLLVADEGAGLPVGPEGAHESRGLGYGLILARSLMGAHGGRLDVKSLARVGTRVRLTFPAERARRAT